VEIKILNIMLKKYDIFTYLFVIIAGINTNNILFLNLDFDAKIIYLYCIINRLWLKILSSKSNFKFKKASSSKKLAVEQKSNIVSVLIALVRTTKKQSV